VLNVAFVEQFAFGLNVFGDHGMGPQRRQYRAIDPRERYVVTHTLGPCSPSAAQRRNGSSDVATRPKIAVRSDVATRPKVAGEHPHRVPKAWNEEWVVHALKDDTLFMRALTRSATRTTNNC
jgi:hypothetical protein